jgi:hypothetical protein
MATLPYNGFGEVGGAAEHRTIPFDYAFRFDAANKKQLKGIPGTVHNDTVTVSIEATFIAVSIGFGVIPSVTPVRVGPPPTPKTAAVANIAPSPTGIVWGATDFTVTTTAPHGFSAGQRITIAGSTSTPSVNGTWVVASATSTQFTVNFIASAPLPGGGGTTVLAGSAPPGSLLQSLPFLDAVAAAFNESAPSATGALGPKTALALRAGLQLNPVLADAVLNQDVTQPLTMGEVFQVVSAGNEDVQFKYAIFDEGTGREFQSEPILSTAGLGISDGERPFRYFARPIEFRPRSTIRMQITEVSNFHGDLHISLQGYKVLGGAGTPTGRARQHIGTARLRGR